MRNESPGITWACQLITQERKQSATHAAKQFPALHLHMRSAPGPTGRQGALLCSSDHASHLPAAKLEPFEQAGVALSLLRAAADAHPAVDASGAVRLMCCQTDVQCLGVA
jgi:hypothetical protein